MKAYRLAKDFFEQVEVEKPENGLKVKYVGICGTDYGIYNGEQPYVNSPVIPGHEVIVEKNGQNYVVYPYNGCGECDVCKADLQYLCFDNKTYGVSIDGGLAEYFEVKDWQLFPVNKDIRFILAEPLAVVLNALEKIKEFNYANILIIGAGTLGILVGIVLIYFYNVPLVKIFDNHGEKLDKALDLQIRPLLNFRDKFDIVINTGSYFSFLDALKAKGKVIQIGNKNGINLNINSLMRKEISLFTVRNSSLKHFSKAIKMLEENIIFNTLITDVVDFDNFDFKKYIKKSNRIKVVVKL